MLNQIIKWVEGKPKFWQVAVERLMLRNELTHEDILDLVEICKTENGLSDVEFEDVDFDALRESVANRTSDSVKLSKIYSIENINAISNNSELEFAQDGVTVVYGDNGSGKSSYVSILKHSCNTRGRKPKINHNLYLPNSAEIDRSATLAYRSGDGDITTAELVNELIDNSDLKQINVFDAYSADHYIEGEDEIAFIPHGISIIEKLASAINEVDLKLKSELDSLSSQRFDYRLLPVPEQTAAKIFLDGLNHRTTHGELTTVSAWDDTKEARANTIIKEIDELNKKDPKKDIKTNSEKINRFNTLSSKLKQLDDKLTGHSLVEIIQVLNNYVTAKETLEVLSTKAFSDLPMKGVGESSWQMLWSSARRFYNESTQTNVFPDTSDDSKCPLCLQELSDEAKIRFTSFEDFIKQDVQKKYDEAKRQYDRLYAGISNISFNFHDVRPTIYELDEHIESFSVHLRTYLGILSKQKALIISLFDSKQTVQGIEDIENKNVLYNLILKVNENLTATNKALSTQSIEESLKPLTNELNQLKGTKILYDNTAKFSREIHRLNNIKLLEECSRKCNTRSITSFSNRLTTSLLTQTLKDNFQDELRKLRFNNIRIDTETKGQRGKQYHYLRLNEENPSNIALKDILSEGEHRCIALATFLSEMSISEHKSAVIFDDPVSSLDHKWRNKIAERITQEGLERQVIVFTHDITFLLMLEEHCNRLSCEISIRSLTRKRQETGIVMKTPPWDTLSIKTRIGVLKNKQQRLRRVEREETEEVYKEQARNFYGKLREAWERFIEEVFLNGTIQRFGRAIQTQRLKAVVDITEDDYKIINDNMSKCSTYLTGHDSAAGLGSEMPDTSELLADVTILEDFANKVKRRR